MDRIYGGNPVDLASTEYPYVVSFFDTEAGTVCQGGGTLITPTVVLTEQDFCDDSLSSTPLEDRVTVRLGCVDVINGQCEEHNFSSFTSDAETSLVLLNLTSPSAVTPISLPLVGSAPVEGDVCTVVGRGNTYLQEGQYGDVDTVGVAGNAQTRRYVWFEYSRVNSVIQDNQVPPFCSEEWVGNRAHETLIAAR